MKAASAKLKNRHDFSGYLDCFLNILFGVRERRETGLILRGSEIDASFKHLSVPFGELLHVGFRGVSEIVNGSYSVYRMELILNIIELVLMFHFFYQ